MAADPRIKDAFMLHLIHPGASQRRESNVSEVWVTADLMRGRVQRERENERVSE